MRSNSRINLEDCILVVVDIQEKFKPVIKGWGEMLENTVKLIKGLQVLDVPIIVTEQYPQGLGETVDEIKQVLSFTPVEKTCFSCFADHEFKNKLEQTGRKHVILAGIEAHICLFNTAIDLIDEGYTVHFVVDAISSREKTDKKTAVKRVIHEGAKVTTTEMILFQLLKDAKTEGFKEISELIK